MGCPGDGTCLTLCYCLCKDICTCSHGLHLDLSEENRLYGYCQKECVFNCKLVECNRFLHCREKFCAWSLKMCWKGDNHNDIDEEDFLDLQECCPICDDYRYMMQLDCNHIACFDCYQHINLDDGDMYYHTRCPVCYE